MKVYQNSDVLYFNLRESPVFKYGISSNKLFEYMAVAKPIIFACRAGNDPIEEAGAGISIPPDNVDELIRACITLYNESAVNRKKMGYNGRNYILKYYTIENLGFRLERMLVNVLKKRNVQ